MTPEEFAKLRGDIEDVSIVLNLYLPEVAKALLSIAGSLEKIANPLRMVDANGIVHTLEDTIHFAGLKIVKDENLGPNEVNFVGGLRESGPD